MNSIQHRKRCEERGQLGDQSWSEYASGVVHLECSRGHCYELSETESLFEKYTPQLKPFRQSSQDAVKVLAVLSLGLSAGETADCLNLDKRTVRRLVEWFFYWWGKDTDFRYDLLLRCRTYEKCMILWAIAFRDLYHTELLNEQPVFLEIVAKLGFAALGVNKDVEEKIQASKKKLQEVIKEFRGIAADLDDGNSLDRLEQMQSLFPCDSRLYFLRKRAFDPLLRANLPILLLEKITGKRLAPDRSHDGVRRRGRLRPAKRQPIC